MITEEVIKNMFHEFYCGAVQSMDYFRPDDISDEISIHGGKNILDFKYRNELLLNSL